MAASFEKTCMDMWWQGVYILRIAVMKHDGVLWAKDVASFSNL